MPPFRRKTLVLIGAQGVGRRSLKNKLILWDPDRYGTTVPCEWGPWSGRCEGGCVRRGVGWGGNGRGGVLSSTERAPWGTPGQVVPLGVLRASSVGG